jgi:hypothetical protein
MVNGSSRIASRRTFSRRCITTRTVVAVAALTTRAVFAVTTRRTIATVTTRLEALFRHAFRTLDQRLHAQLFP